MQFVLSGKRTNCIRAYVDKELITELFEKYKPSVVVNLAAQAGVRYSITNPDAYVESNLVGFFNILEACRHCESLEHLVYASSSSVYGSNKKVPYSTDDGSPSPMLLERFLNEKGYNIKQIGNIEFRSKTNFALKGKRIRLEPVGVQDLYTYAFLTCMDYTDNCYRCKYASQDSFMRMFLRNYCLRPSCYECEAKLVRCADLTLADFWGINFVAPEMNDNKGVSLVIIRSQRGHR